MYLSKETHHAELYDPKHDHYSPDRLALVGELRRAIDERELVVYYQPRIELSSGSASSVEALIRWNHPERGLLGPGEFLPLAQHTGIVRLVTRYMLEEALQQCRDATAQLHGQVDDTLNQTATNVFRASSEAYAHMRAAAATSPGLQRTLGVLGTRRKTKEVAEEAKAKGK